MIKYLQSDPRWAKHIYSAIPPHTETIESSGCGVTTAAMIISNLTDTVVTPDVMADYSLANGYRLDGVGTAFGLFPSIAKKYNLKCIQTKDIKNAIECVENGGLVVCSTDGSPTGLFSTGGHIFIMSDTNGDIIEFIDPLLYDGKYDVSYRKYKAKVTNGCVYVNKDIAKQYISVYFLFSKIATIKEENKMIYNYIDNNMPEWARKSVQWAVDNGIVKGSENGLNLDDQDLQTIVWIHRASLLK